MLVLCTQVNIKFVMLLGIESQNMIYSNRPDHIAQLAEHWASIPQVVSLISTVARHIFQVCPVWIYNQSNITNKHHMLP